MHGHVLTDLATGPAPRPPAAQQPLWADHPAYARTCAALAVAPALVSWEEVAQLRRSLEAVAEGRAVVAQVGDCAESFYEITPARTAEKLCLLDQLGDEMERVGGRPVVRIGRLGGQFAKPRSSPTERHGTTVLPSFRGHLVNSEVPTVSARQHDPRRMLWAYEASGRVVERVRGHRERQGTPAAGQVHRGPWTSHEALVLDYERSLVRTGEAGPFLASTHLPWIGLRTNDPDAEHVELLGQLENPVGCKIGPGSDPALVRALCDRLDPQRTPGRLVLIARMGARAVGDVLPPLVEAVRRAGHRPVWLCDPMHGNTVTTGTGHKTRHLRDIQAEALVFREVVEGLGMCAGGLHLEVAAEDVTECVGGPVRDESEVPGRYTTLCDPRLNPEQARHLVGAWS
ncbi:3-deoxy-7-phosphoheptulonate synthase [Blastococcus sp. KM273128]|uniref:3-deoxy-7-phosphoheptulonate synthase n=1 Tax=Blastococcus sp. KM273128 TaxID=2570314 RepID=UPI001F1C6390|nr:3-deoxy-7-phosphoheptulonate synthase [Blastococcus sp. KM273128]MCF6744044.1 3-deoxy-7-phosphoheptulonate synthase [Blastococcus sp. KM273128]